MTIQLGIHAFRSRFPEFDSVGEPIILTFMDMATTQLDKVTWSIGDDYERGILFWTAHMVSKYVQTQANAADGSGATDLFVQSIHFGERSVSFGRRTDTSANSKALGEGEPGLDDTMYGQLFLMLRKRNVPSITVV